MTIKTVPPPQVDKNTDPPPKKKVIMEVIKKQQYISQSRNNTNTDHNSNKLDITNEIKKKQNILPQDFKTVYFQVKQKTKINFLKNIKIIHLMQ